MAPLDKLRAGTVSAHWPLKKVKHFHKGTAPALTVHQSNAATLPRPSLGDIEAGLTARMEH
eukprot:5978819-Lingulodinium_polyedra.AAC.1